MFFSFFPFICFFDIGTDTQPYAFIVSLLIIIFLSGFRTPVLLLPLLLSSILAVLILIVYGKYGMLEFRSLFNYLSVTAISYASYIGIKKTGGIKEKHIKLMINIWFMIGLIQTFIKRDFLLFLVAGGRTSLERGVTNLTSEPSFYGYMIVFALLFVMDFKEKRYLYIMNLLIQLFVFAQSAVAIVYLMVYLLLLLAKNVLRASPASMLRIVTTALICLIGLTLYFNIYPNSRATVLLNSIVSDPQAVYLKDASVRARVNHIAKPLKEAVRYKLFPAGYSKALEDLGYRRIMSGYGAAIYELGIIGIIIVLNIFYIVFTADRHSNHKMNSVYVSIIMFSAIQLASPILAFYLGYVLNLNSSECQHKKLNGIL